MPRSPEAYRRSTLFDAIHKEILVSEPLSQKREGPRERTLRGTLKKSLAGLFRNASQQAYLFDAADSPSSIILDDNGIKAATLEKLIEKLTSNQYAKVEDIETFLFSYGSYITPLRLLELLQSRFTAQAPKNSTEAEIEIFLNEKQKYHQIRVVRFIKVWLEKLPIDWADMELRVAAVQFFRNIVLPSGVSTTAERIMQSIDVFKYVPVVATEDPPKPFDKSTFDFWAFPIEEIARQLTLLEFEGALLVRPHEFFKQAWTKRDAKKKAPGIFSLVKHFNKTTAWVRTEILAQDILKYRVEMLRKFIEISAQLHALKNMNALMEVISALDSTPIQRLARTWAGLMPQEMAVFEAFRSIISPQRSYSKYREAMKSMEPPHLPYIGVALSDLTFIDEGTPDLVGELCNFQKATAIATIIRDFVSCQAVAYDFIPHPHMQKYILEFKGFSEEDSYAVSQEIEPRAAKELSLSGSSSVKDVSALPNAKRGEALIGEISAVVAAPPQKLLSTSAAKLRREEEGSVPFLDLRGTVCVKLQLLGASIPIAVAFPRDTTSAQALLHLSVHLSGVGPNSVLALMPSVLLPEGLVLERDATLERYEGKILVILNDPLRIKIGVSKNTFLEGVTEVLVDSKAPLFSLLPILCSVFKVDCEFSFLYVEGSTSARWLSQSKGLIDQCLNDLEGLLLIYPISNLTHRSAASLSMTDKSGWLQVKIKSNKKLSIASGSGKRQWVVLLDHYLFIYKTQAEAAPSRVVSLENHAVRLERSARGVQLIISRPNEPNDPPYPTVVLGSTEGSNVLYDWLQAMERTCHHISGKDHMFGAELSLARSGLPVVVEKCAIFLMARTSTPNLFFEQGNRAMIEYFKLQFDQGVDVEFTQYNADAHTVAQLLKLYLSQLPSPLLPWESTLSSSGKVDALRDVVASLDSAYRTVLSVVLGLIGERFTAEDVEELGELDERKPGDFWRIFLRIPDNYILTSEDENMAFMAINELVMSQDPIFVEFKESTISRRLRVKLATARRKYSERTIGGKSTSSWKVEAGPSFDSAKHSESQQKTAAKVEEAKVRIEQQFGLRDRVLSSSEGDNKEPSSIFPAYKSRSGRARLQATVTLSSSPPSPSSSSNWMPPSPVLRSPSTPFIKIMDASRPNSSHSSYSSPLSSPRLSSPDNRLNIPSSRSVPIGLSLPPLDSSPPSTPPSSLPIPISPLLHKPRSQSAPLIPKEEENLLLEPAQKEAPPRAFLLRKITRRNVNETPENWGRACANCGKSFALNGEVSCKGCGYVPSKS